VLNYGRPRRCKNHDGRKIQQEGPPGDPRHNSDGSSPTEVLETMRNIIVELQVFKANNEN
jgi:hypothetical protein